MKTDTIKSDDSPAAHDSWAVYCERMKGQAAQEYLAGDMQGYRRGYSDGATKGKQQTTDLTLAGAMYVAIIAGALGFLVGFNLALS